MTKLTTKEEIANELINSHDFDEFLTTMANEEQKNINILVKNGSIIKKEIEKNTELKKYINENNIDGLYAELADKMEWCELSTTLTKYFEYMTFASQKEKAFIDAIIIDKPAPKLTLGWRYGNIPDDDRSFNYRDQINEHGVSFMDTKGEKPNKGFAGCIHKEANTPIIIAAGYQVNERGSDGEALLVGSKEIKRIIADEA